MESGFTGEPIPVLGQHNRHASGGYQISYSVHAGALQTRPALAGVRYLFEYLVPLSRRIGSESLYLLGEAVTLRGLLLGADASVEDERLGIAVVGAKHRCSSL